MVIDPVDTNQWLADDVSSIFAKSLSDLSPFAELAPISNQLVSLDQ